jgi:hypothetical protein
MTDDALLWDEPVRIGELVFCFLTVYEFVITRSVRRTRLSRRIEVRSVAGLHTFNVQCSRRMLRLRMAVPHFAPGFRAGRRTAGASVPAQAAQSTGRIAAVAAQQPIAESPSPLASAARPI